MKNYLLKQSYQALFYPILFVLLMWVMFLTGSINHYNFLPLGVLPREMKGLPGVITSVFVHADIQHIASNSIPLLVLGMMLFYFYKKIAKPAFLWIWFISGLWLWLGGRGSEAHPTYHIGASTLVYGLATFLFFSGVFRKHLRLMVVSALVVFLYGGIVWGIFPLKEEMSWEGHLFGAFSGVLVAFNYRKEGPKQKVYEWPEEENDANEENFSFESPEQPFIVPSSDSNQDFSANEIKINFIYKNKKT
jgi:membrane associated rhomboid family serine protease